MYLRFLVVFVVLFVVINDVDSSKNESEPCREIPRKDIEQHLSTKTPYRAIANFNDKPKEFEGCHPSRIWSIIRHGSRNPSKKVIHQIKTKLSALRDHILTTQDVKLCPSHLERLGKWNFTVSAEEEKYLVAEGEDELIELAERMQKRFPTLLPGNYNPQMYYFKYTATQRTLKSAQSFATGLFGRHRIGDIVYPEALHKDPVLRDFRKFYSEKSIKPYDQYDLVKYWNRIAEYTNDVGKLGNPINGNERKER